MPKIVIVDLDFEEQDIERSMIVDAGMECAVFQSRKADDIIRNAADADGIITFTAAPYPYDIHIIQMPAGYTYDDMQDSKAPEAGGIMTFMLSQD